MTQLYGTEQLPRAGVIAGGAILIAIWIASLVYTIKVWDPRADGFFLIPLFYASISVLPLGLSVLFGALSGSDRGMRRARRHLVFAAMLLALVLALEILRRLSEAFG
jgi:hypothetical protein